MVDITPRQAENLRARPAILKQNTRPPTRYGYENKYMYPQVLGTRTWTT